MAIEVLQQSLQSKIEKTIQEHAKEEAEAIIKTAMAEFEQRLRKTIGSLALSILSYYSIERVGSELLIRVKIEGEK